jgi:DNA polymerase-3 subunit epsilon
MTRYLALDFETASHAQDSACALGLALVEDGRIVAEDAFLIRPPEPEFVFTYIHGLRWEDVADAPTFDQAWPRLAPWLDNADWLVAHNAPFDRGVLAACCRTYRMATVDKPFLCTVQVARRVWGIYPTKLPLVCRALDIPLRHHDAASDASACAQIIVRALDEGWRPTAAAYPGAAPSKPGTPRQ